MIRGIGSYKLGRDGRFSKRAITPRVSSSKNAAYAASSSSDGISEGITLPNVEAMGNGLMPGTQTRAFARPTNLRLHAGLLSDSVHEHITIAREMFDNDPVAGAVVETVCGIPFGNFSLSGMPNKDHLKPYLRSMDRVRIKTLLSSLAMTYLVDGMFLGTGVFDDKDKCFSAMIPQDVLFADIKPVPFFGATPVVDIKLTNEMMRMLNADTSDERMRAYIKHLPPELIKSGSLQLAPENTFFIPRRGLVTQNLGVSLYRKIMIVYILEKALERGTIELAYRRQRAVLHVPVGDENWDASTEDMQTIANLFLQADLDPLGAVVVTRQGVNPQEIGGAGDFWKWTDNIDVLTSVKLKGLGMPDGLLGGDLSLDSVSATLTIFINMIRAFRDYITRSFFYEKMFPYVAVTNNHRKETLDGYVETGSNNGSFNYTNNYVTVAKDLDVDMSDYVFPTIQWHNCVTGSTLIPTTKGVMRIDQMITGKGLNQSIDFEVASRFGVERAKYGLVKKPTAVTRLKTDLGFELTGTDEHKVLVLADGEHKWLRIKEVKRGMNLCVNLNPVLRNTSLELGLSASIPRSRSSMPELKRPLVMTPDLAFILGIILAEGTVRPHNVQIPNSDLRLLAATNECIYRVFGIRGNIREVDISSCSRSKKKFYSLGLYSLQACTWLRELGVGNEISRRGKSIAYDKEIPVAILQADKESQLAFLAAFIEGDGHVAKDRGVIIYTSSTKIAEQIQVLLLAHGYLAQRGKKNHKYWTDRGIKRDGHCIRMRPRFAAMLLEDAKNYFVSKYVKIAKNSNCHCYGLPLGYWKKLIRSRKAGKGVFTRDDGSLVQASINAVKNFGRSEVLLYDEDKTQEKYLALCEKVSVNAAIKLRECLALRYVYTKVTEKRSAGVEKVYDITIHSGEPAYVANGLISHNSMRPEGDKDYLDLLMTLQQAGVPIPVRMLAAAGGQDIHDILNGAEDDVEINAKIAQYKAALAQVGGGGEGQEGGEGQGDDYSYASFNPYRKLSPIKPKGLLNREFDDRMFSRTNINGHSYVTTARERKRMEEKKNRVIAQSAAEVSRKMNRLLRGKDAEGKTSLVQNVRRNKPYNGPPTLYRG